ncbi:MAG: ATP-binding protein [Pseudomonadota bacterium]
MPELLPSPLKERCKRLVILAAIMLATILIIWQVAIFTEKRSFEQIRRTGKSRIALYGASLRDALERYRHIPYILARDSRIRALLRQEIVAVGVNPHLEDFSLMMAGVIIYVMNDVGDTVASSNWRTEQSLVGENFDFRPYFQDAKEGKSGSYYTVGLKTRKPGFYISYPVLETGKLLGVVVVKVDLDDLENAWQESGETIIVSDSYGVVFLSSRPEWKYTSLRPLPPDTVKRLRTKQYLDRQLPTLAIERQVTEGGNILLLDRSSFLEQSLQLLDYGWRIHYLTDLAPIGRSVGLVVAVSTVFAFAMFLILLYLRERRQKLLSRREAREVQATLQLNELLQKEVTQRRETEQTLRRTQKELVQAGKLAALGTMSAAIAHELNQPVTAIGTFIASCRIFLERQQLDQVRANLGHIDKLTERMTSITRQLKTFARKSKGREEPVDLTEIIDRVLVFSGPQLEASRVMCTIDLTPPGVAVVQGDGLQLEQVMTNLLRNAMDAIKHGDRREIWIRLTVSDGHAVLSCRDSGPGISQEALEYLFDPFYTTKDIGEGLGLGLSISYGIVKEMNGTIDAGNDPDGGAIFTLRLPLAASLPTESRGGRQ